MSLLNEYVEKAISPETLEVLKGDELPEGVTIESLLEQEKQNAKDVWLIESKDSLIKEAIESHEYKKGIEIENSWRSTVKKILGWDVKHKDLKRDEFIKQAKAQFAEKVNATGDDVKKQLTEKHNEVLNLSGKIGELEELLEAEKNGRKQFESTLRDQVAADNYKGQVYDKVPWAYEGEVLAEKKSLLDLKASTLFNIKGDGSFTDKDGKAVPKMNGHGAYKKFDEWVEDYTKKFNMVKKSNGTPNGGKPADPFKKTNAFDRGPGGKEIDRSRSAAKVANSPKLKEFMASLEA